MAEDPIETLRLSLMQDVLPVGMAMVQRARKGGVIKVAEAFTDTEEPLQVLRVEGESAAKTLREQLDKVSPGLGNPVVPVQVAVDESNLQVDLTSEEELLMQVLDRIQVGMEELESRLFDDSSQQSNFTSDSG